MKMVAYRPFIMVRARPAGPRTRRASLVRRCWPRCRSRHLRCWRRSCRRRRCSARRRRRWMHRPCRRRRHSAPRRGVEPVEAAACAASTSSGLSKRASRRAAGEVQRVVETFRPMIAMAPNAIHAPAPAWPCARRMKSIIGVVQDEHCIVVSSMRSSDRDGLQVCDGHISVAIPRHGHRREHRGAMPMAMVRARSPSAEPVPNRTRRCRIQASHVGVEMVRRRGRNRAGSPSWAACRAAVPRGCVR